MSVRLPRSVQHQMASRKNNLPASLRVHMHDQASDLAPVLAPEPEVKRPQPGTPQVFPQQAVEEPAHGHPQQGKKRVVAVSVAPPSTKVPVTSRSRGSAVPSTATPLPLPQAVAPLLMPVHPVVKAKIQEPELPAPPPLPLPAPPAAKSTILLSSDFLATKTLIRPRVAAAPPRLQMPPVVEN